MLIKLNFIAALCVSAYGYQLKQVIVLGRHSIRTPLEPSLEEYTPKHWPTWNVMPGYLTEKGGRIEHFMGKYLSDWLIEEQLLSDNCPKDDAFVYSNMIERTIETANAFIEGAFGDCVTDHYKHTLALDPVFNLVVKNASLVFKYLVEKEIAKELENIQLKAEFAEMERILDFKNSPYCKRSNVCELEKVKHQIIVELGEEPDVRGPLQIASLATDNFLMAYYDGMKKENVAWGELTTIEQFKTLMNIIKTYQKLLYKPVLLNKDVSKGLLEYLTNIFLTGDKKFYLLVGHDVNIISLMSSLHFEHYYLHDQIEDAPIGGKVVFQKWYDEENDRYLLRVNYVYQSVQQIRDGAVVSLENPPQWALLQLKQCAVDKYGFCPWNDFINVLKNV